MTRIDLIGGLDIGNGYVKGVFRNTMTQLDTVVDIPSGVMMVTRPNRLRKPDDEAPAIIDGEGRNSFENVLDASFTSPLISDQYRRLFGARGLSASGVFEEFDMVGNKSKAEQELSAILVLGLCASKGLGDYVREHKSLPDATDVLDVRVRLGMALPITEYRDHRDNYVSGFIRNTHTVTIHNFETFVTVKVTFENIQVIAEGASAQYAINAKGEPLMKAMLAEARSKSDIDPQITAKDLLAAENTIGIDIGEGTVNFPVFTGGAFNEDSSRTFSKGYGSVLTEAMRYMEDQNMNTGFKSRKALADYLQREPSPLKRNHYARIQSVVDEEIRVFAEEVAKQFSVVLSDVGSGTEVIYVYGGGSGPVKATLYDLLIAKAHEMNGEDAPLILYLDSSYSRNLNREGLFLAADAVARATASKKTTKK